MKLVWAIALVCCGWAAAEEPDYVAQAKASAEIAGPVLDKVHRWLHEIALPKIDPKTGLYLADGKWDYRDTAADCLPYLVWAAWATDREALDGPVRQVLSAERRLCNVLDSIPAPYDFETGKPKELAKPDLIFEASEYVKDGLVPIVEILGQGPWFDRMREITEDIWKHADVETKFGLIPSDNVEVNGEQLQILARLYSMTGDGRYLGWAARIADHYLADPEWVPERLRDHGCEIIGGLGLFAAIYKDSHPDSDYERKYRARMEKLYDTILERGTNPDGFMYNMLPATPPTDVYADLSDGWGYNYVGMLCHDLTTRTEKYRPHVVKVLENLQKPQYAGYRWEGSIDGYADSIEGAMYLLQYVPSETGTAWVNQEMQAHVLNGPLLENGELWGTMKLQSNAVRTSIMYALMRTKGFLVRPWQPGLKIGVSLYPTAFEGRGQFSGATIWVSTQHEYEGVLGLAVDEKDSMQFPRMNRMPAWLPQRSLDYIGDEENIEAYVQAGIRINLPAGGSKLFHLVLGPNC